ncbi:hypothetical protein Agub_g10257, partial [Astrephomene gubernaculifera]
LSLYPCITRQLHRSTKESRTTLVQASKPTCWGLARPPLVNRHETGCLANFKSCCEHPMFKKLLKKIKNSVKKSSHSNSPKTAVQGLGEPGGVDVVKPTRPPVPAIASSNEMAAPVEETAKSTKPVKLAGACPSYAAKSVVGQRMTMEDSWQAVPDLLVIPKWWTCNARDHLPPLIPRQGDAAVDPQPKQQGQDEVKEPANSGPDPSIQPASTPPGRPQDGAAAAPAAVESIDSPPLDPKQLAATHGTDPVTVHFFAVYDGHGGADVAKHCAKSLHEHLKAVVTASLKPDGTSASGPLLSPAGPSTSGSGQETGATSAAPADPPAEQWPVRVDGIEAALKSAFLHTDAQLAQTRSAHEVGTTAVVSLVTARHLWVGNCGDSRALLCREREAVALSLDHKATRADEVARVEQAGGYVWWDRVMGELAVSRAIGDHCLRPFVIAEPEITSVLRRPEDQLLIMASDGLWDVFTNEEARTLALEKFSGELQRTSSSKMAVKKAASSLAKAALAKGSRDNVTVVVVDVRLHGSSAHRHAAAAAAAAHAAAASGATAAAAAGSAGSFAQEGPARCNAGSSAAPAPGGEQVPRRSPSGDQLRKRATPETPGGMEGGDE